MTRTQAHVAFLMLKKLVEYVRKNGGNRDTYIFNSLCDVFDELKKLYQFDDNGK